MLGKDNKITLKEILKLIAHGDEEQPIILMDDARDWVGTFPCIYSPKEYEDFIVTDIMVVPKDGSVYYDVPAIKIWIEEK